MKRKDRLANRLQERNSRSLLFIASLFFFCVLLILSFKNEQYTYMLLVLGTTTIFLITSKYWMILKDKGIPVLSFHSISDDTQPFPWPYIRLPIATFRRIIQLLHNKGYQTISLSDVALHMKGEKKLDAKSIALTFDDGYLDNWIVVYPLLKKYGFSGTIFVPTDFIDYNTKIRPTLEDLEKKIIAPEDMEWEGYLSVQELKRMDSEGILHIESHTVSHTWLYKNDQIREFLSPGNKMMIWNFWNMFPEYKYAGQKYFPQKKDELLGNPTFDFSRAHLVEKAFFPDKKISKELNTAVRTADNPNKRPGNLLPSILKNHHLNPSGSFPGHWESTHESQKRLNMEFAGSKIILEKILNREINHLCWPGDIFTEKLLSKVIQDYGYQTVTGGLGRNTIKNNPQIISRIYVKHTYSPFSSKYLDLFLFYSAIKVFEGNLYFFLPCMIFNQLNKITMRAYRKELQAASS